MIIIVSRGIFPKHLFPKQVVIIQVQYATSSWIYKSVSAELLAESQIALYSLHSALHRA